MISDSEKSGDNMSLNSTPSSDRVHIAFFGRRNAGKSSVVNAVTGQKLAIVSDVAGTTTDPVLKAMELLPLGPVVIIDTPGIDDEGELGSLRVKRSYQMLNKADVAVLVIDSEKGFTDEDIRLLERIKEKSIPYIVVYNKNDLKDIDVLDKNEISVSALSGKGIHELKERIARLAGSNKPEKHIVSDMLEAGDAVVLVVPIDSAAPKGRLILPQQQTIRDIIDNHSFCTVVQPSELTSALAKM